MSSEPSDLMDFVLGFLWWIWWAPMARQRNGKIRCIQTDVVTSRPVMKRGASQIVVPFRCAPFCRPKKNPSQLLSHSQFTNQSEANKGVSHSSLPVFSLFSLLFTLSSVLGRSGLRPSLVRRDSPRNAPLKTTPHDRYVFFQHGTCREWRWLPRHIMIKARMVSGMKG